MVGCASRPYGFGAGWLFPFKTSHRKIPQSLEATRFVFWIVGLCSDIWQSSQQHCCISNYKSCSFETYCTRSYDVTSYPILKWTPGHQGPQATTTSLKIARLDLKLSYCFEIWQATRQQCSKLSQKSCQCSCLESQIINIKLKKIFKKVPGPPPKWSASGIRTGSNFEHCRLHGILYDRTFVHLVNIKAQGPVSRMFFHCNSDPMEISFCSHSDNNKVIATKFCTAVVAWAKICGDLMAINWITARRTFHRIWIASKKTFGKWAPGCTLAAVDGSVCLSICLRSGLISFQGLTVPFS